MKLTKYTHSCVRLDEADRSLVIDPGSFSEAATALAGADAVLITHEHPDHVDLDAVRTAAKANRDLVVKATPAVVSTLADLGDQVQPAGPGEQFELAGFSVQTFGGQHALIHTSVPMIANTAYLIDDVVYHPGDSFAVPPTPVPVLLIPSTAPWARVGEVLDFMIAMRSPLAFPIHDGIVNDLGRGIVEGHLTRIGQQYGTEFSHLDPGRSATL
ncbi:MAG: MBL fold metallo-hydrolase [Actinobacteria bacterium]|nr:MBL fold metallo-hydrolase [Actinomycetota bacterium]